MAQDTRLLSCEPLTSIADRIDQRERSRNTADRLRWKSLVSDKLTNCEREAKIEGGCILYVRSGKQMNVDRACQT